MVDEKVGKPTIRGPSTANTTNNSRRSVAAAFLQPLRPASQEEKESVE